MTQHSQLPKILLVDDNDMAREMVRVLLENVGIHVVEADNGLDAIDKFVTEEFDLVLMDIQMPVLDGHSAAREIRNLDCPYSATVPIIAMTANSFSEFRVESLAAGMNGHVGKPLDLNNLCAELKRWLPPEKHFAFDSILTPVGADFSTLKKLLPQIDVKAGMARVAGDQQLYFNLLKRFVGRFSTLETDLAAIIAEGDNEEAVRYAHTLKGVAGGLGATVLQLRAEELETQLSQQTVNPQLITSVVEELNPLLENMKAALAWGAPETGSDKDKSRNDKELEVLLGQMKEPLLNLQVQQVQQLQLQLDAMEWPEKYREKLVELEPLIAGYQFTAAAALIESLLVRPL